ncbi:MAG: hypothetical protein NVS9B4_28620 [Candidatus Acidiferrum sp.]
MMIEHLRPQYVFRPAQVVRRLGRKLKAASTGREVVRLPWGLNLEVDTADNVGCALANQGIYDILATETLWRLTAPSDIAVDAGANIGYMTSLLATRGAAVVSFEPHPKTYELLKKNLDGWPRHCEVEIHQKALSDTAGHLHLTTPENFSQSYLGDPSSGSVPVETVKLDDGRWPAKIGVLKIDTEGHEASVLRGAQDHLRRGAIRDILFEEHQRFPAESHEILLRHGYRIFWFEEHLMGPHMIDPRTMCKRRSYDIMPSYLATVDPYRAQQLMSKAGWKSFC